jgi:hypothetical protein
VSLIVNPVKFLLLDVVHDGEFSDEDTYDQPTKYKSDRLCKTHPKSISTHLDLNSNVMMCLKCANTIEGEKMPITAVVAKAR